MSAPGSPVYRDWYARGQNDLDDAEVLLNQKGHLENVAFLIQQALEKHLKGYLIGQGWALERTHDLELLLNRALHYDQSFAAFDLLCRTASEYYFESRYPDSPVTDYTEAEILQTLIEARKLLEHIRALLPP